MSDVTPDTLPSSSAPTPTDQPDERVPDKQKQTHGNPQVGLCAGGSLIATPGFSL